MAGNLINWKAKYNWFDFIQKSQKKCSKNQNRWFYDINLAPELRNDEKLSKKRINQARFTQFFVLVWYISDASWWICMSRRFKIGVAKGGRGYFRPSFGRLKLTLIPKKKSVSKKTNRATILKFWKLCPYLFLWHLIFLLTDCIWSPSPDFGQPIQGQKFVVPPFIRIFWILRA